MLQLKSSKLCLQIKLKKITSHIHKMTDSKSQVLRESTLSVGSHSDFRTMRENFRQKYQPVEYKTVIIAHAGCGDGTASTWTLATIAHNFKNLRACGYEIDQVLLIEEPIYIHFTNERDISLDKRMPNLSV